MNRTSARCRRRGAPAEARQLSRPQSERPESGPGPAHHGRITKQGRGHARGMLVEAAWAAARGPGPLRAFFQRVRARRGQHVAAVATARKLACRLIIIGAVPVSLGARAPDSLGGTRGPDCGRARGRSGGRDRAINLAPLPSDLRQRLGIGVAVGQANWFEIKTARRVLASLRPSSRRRKGSSKPMAASARQAGNFCRGGWIVMWRGWRGGIDLPQWRADRPWPVRRRRGRWNQRALFIRSKGERV